MRTYNVKRYLVFPIGFGWLVVVSWTGEAIEMLKRASRPAVLNNILTVEEKVKGQRE